MCAAEGKRGRKGNFVSFDHVPEPGKSQAEISFYQSLDARTLVSGIRTTLMKGWGINLRF